MIIAAAIGLVIVFLLINPEPALAWGPVTHLAMGVQALATVVTPEHPLQSILSSLPEVFLYGSLAPDIVQGRRLQSRMRRHSHNWSTGIGLLEVAQGPHEQAFAYGYMAHLATDVVAHNFFLPARFVGHFDQGLASHIYNEACFDAVYDAEYRELLLKLLELDFAALDRMLNRAIDSPLISFAAHRRLFEGGLRRIQQWHRVIRVTGGHARLDPDQVRIFARVSGGALAETLGLGGRASCCKLDPMGAEAIRNALSSRRSLQRLTRMGPQARQTAHKLAAAMMSDLMGRLKQLPFGEG